MLYIGDQDGHGWFRVLGEDGDGLLCHECGERFTRLGMYPDYELFLDLRRDF